MANQTKTHANKAPRTRTLTGETFDALSAAEKERVYQQFEELTPPKIKSEFRPLSAKKRVEHMQPKPGRPKIGKGVKVISLSVEKDLLKRADLYAKQHGMKRTELVAVGLKLAMNRG